MQKEEMGPGTYLLLRVVCHGCQPVGLDPKTHDGGLGSRDRDLMEEPSRKSKGKESTPQEEIQR